MGAAPKYVLTGIIIFALASTANAEIITLQGNTDSVLMPLFNKLVLGQILSAAILGVSAIVCCLIMKKKS